MPTPSIEFRVLQGLLRSDPEYHEVLDPTIATLEPGVFKKNLLWDVKKRMLPQGAGRARHYSETWARIRIPIKGWIIVGVRG